MLISTDCGYNEPDLPSKFHNVPLSFKIVLTVVGRHFGSLMNFHMLRVHAGEQKIYSVTFIVRTGTAGIEEKQSINMSQICNFNVFFFFFLSPTEIIDQSTTLQLYDRISC